jgi:hypothetical protein
MLVLGCAAMAFAVPADIPADTKAAVAKGGVQVTIFGDLRFRGSLLVNTRDFNSNLLAGTANGNNEVAIMQSRVRLGFDIAANANTTGRILLEASNGANGDNNLWGSGPSAATSGIGGASFLPMGDSKRDSMMVLEAWLQHKGNGLFGVPSYIKIGHMPVKLSPNGLFYSHTRFNDDALIVGIEPVKGWNAHLAWVKQAEGAGTAVATTFTGSVGPNLTFSQGSDRKNNDMDTYTFITTYDINKDSQIGLDVTYALAQNALSNTNPAGNYAYDANLWNFGINGKTRIAGLGLALDMAFQTGKVKDMGLNVEDLKIGGWAARFDADYKFAPVTVKFAAGYGSGDAGDKINALGQRVKNKTFFTTQDNIQHLPTFVYEYFTPNAANSAYAGLQNTWYLSVGANADITKELYGEINLTYLRAVKAANNIVNVNGGSFVSNVYGFAGAGSDGVANTGQAIAGSKSLGWEVDATMKYKIDKNLTYYVEAGYLFAGNFFQAVTGKNAAGAFINPDDAYAVRHGIQLSF